MFCSRFWLVPRPWLAHQLGTVPAIVPASNRAPLLCEATGFGWAQTYLYSPQKFPLIGPSRRAETPAAVDTPFDPRKDQTVHQHADADGHQHDAHHLPGIVQLAAHVQQEAQPYGRLD